MNGGDIVVEIKTATELLNQLEEVRSIYQLSIDNFCRALSISPATYYRWKQGAIPGTIETAVKIITMLQGGCPANGEE